MEETTALSGYEDGQDGEELILGVLRCARASCSFRVTGVTEEYCCQACEDESGDEHDHECLQMPLGGFSLESRTERGFADYQQFSTQLRKLLAEKGPQHVGSLPHVWDAEYGSGSWVKSRPVKSASKACNSYSSGVKVLDQVVHCLEEPYELDANQVETFEADACLFRSFSPEVIDVLCDEFDLLEQSYEVSTSIALVRTAMDLKGRWCCKLILREMRSSPGENEEGADGPVQNAPPESPKEFLSCGGYGHLAEHALCMARLHILEKLDRWDATDSLPRLRQLEKQLQDCANDMVHPQKGEDEAAKPSELGTPRTSFDGAMLRSTLEEFTELIERLLLKPNPKSFVVWRLLARSWPFILTFAQEDCLERLRHSMCMSSRSCSLNLWLSMAEVAAYQYHRPILEMLEEVPVQDENLHSTAYCRHQLFNLLLELREQVVQELSKSSRAQFVNFRWGLGQGGITCTMLEALKGKVDAISLTVGEVTFLCEAIDENRFVVRAINSSNAKALSVAFQSERMWCRPLATYATIAARQREALKNLVNAKSKVAFCPILKGAIIESWSASQMLDVDAESCVEKQDTLHRCEVVFASAERWEDPEEMMSKLSLTQQQAVMNAMSRRCSLVRGPPGTGKTHVAAAVALAAAQNLPDKERVLCVTQSHAAALNLHRRLESFGVAVARVGTTLTPTEIVEQSIFQKVKEYWGEDDEEVNFMELASQEADYTGERSKELQKNQFAVMRRMIFTSRVAVLTLASSGNTGLLSGMSSCLPVLVIDEAAQVVEPGPWVPLTWGCERLVLVGDEKQLPATVLHPHARETGLGVSMFERFVRDGLVSLGHGLVQLDEQQRMHPSIAQFPSLSFYGGTLTNGPDTLLRQKIDGFPWPNPESHVAFVECGAMCGEEGGRSHANPQEAEALMAVLEHCLRRGLEPYQVGVITGYSAQQELLQRHWAALAPELGFGPKELRVDTVDGFQGAERDLILASTVRSFFEVGFMRDPRRANVMLTRARRGLIVFGNAETLSTEAETWKPWVDWVRQRHLQIDLKHLMAQLDTPGRPLGPRAATPEEPPVSKDVQETQEVKPRSVFPPARPAVRSNVYAPSKEWLTAEVPRAAPATNGTTECKDETRPSSLWLDGHRAVFAAAEVSEPAGSKLPQEAAPANTDGWEEYADPNTGNLWLWNPVTQEAKWKD